MALFRLVVSACLVFATLHKTDAIKGGNSVSDPCTFPGLAVVFNPSNSNQILCTGVIVDGEMIMPRRCQFILNGAFLHTPLVIRDADYSWGYPKSTILSGTNEARGTFKFSLNNQFRAKIDEDKALCSDKGTLYDGSEDLVTGTCQLASYGGATNAPANFDVANLESTNIVKSTSATCCKSIEETLTSKEKGSAFFSSFIFNCVKATGSPCGLGDFGAPVMCNTKSGVRVTLGLVSSTPCQEDSLFLINDLTESSSKTKFGLNQSKGVVTK